MDLDSLSSFTLVGTMDTKDYYNLAILSTELTTIAVHAFLDLCGALCTIQAYSLKLLFGFLRVNRGNETG